ncbi:MAG: hypothetical protein FGM32_06605 [Candidatus Kapabacteria bacterium]|nr:hypothetical protein [Candidatus Kapabacteria bacterium]
MITTTIAVVAQGEPIDSFRGYKWGASEEAVKKSISKKKYTVIDSIETLRIYRVQNEQMFSLPGTIEFDFFGEKLIGGGWIYTAGSTAAGTISQIDFTTAVSSLSKKYGSPEVYRVNEQDRKFESPNAAYEDFDYKVRNRITVGWLDDGNEIRLQLVSGGERMEIYYQSKQFYEVMTQVEDY